MPPFTKQNRAAKHVQAPPQREVPQEMEFPNQLDLEFSTGSTIGASLGYQTNCMGFRYPFFDADFVALQASLTFNCGEFAIIKIQVVNLLPDAPEFDRIAIAQPIGNEAIPILRVMLQMQLENLSIKFPFSVVGSAPLVQILILYINNEHATIVNTNTEQRLDLWLRFLHIRF